jgi:hypothetical protein
MPPKVYIETTIPSYLTARPSRDLVRTAQQQLTREWWRTHRKSVDLYISALVFKECSQGDALAATERLHILQGLPLLEVTEEVIQLTSLLLESKLIPAKAAPDAAHVALASVHSMDFLLTWNCRHIHNAFIQTRLEKLCRQQRYSFPVICTPPELMGDRYAN